MVYIVFVIIEKSGIKIRQFIKIESIKTRGSYYSPGQSFANLLRNMRHPGYSGKRESGPDKALSGQMRLLAWFLARFCGLQVPVDGIKGVNARNRGFSYGKPVRKRKLFLINFSNYFILAYTYKPSLLY